MVLFLVRTWISPPPCHGLPRIDIKIEQHLLNLSLIHGGLPQIAIKGLQDADLFSCFTEHSVLLGDERIQIGGCGFMLASPCKGQELTGQCFGPLDCGFNICQVPCVTMGGGFIHF